MNRIETLHLFDPLDRELILLLRRLKTADWSRPTLAKKWRVKDVAAHLLDGNLRTLSMLRDGYVGVQPTNFTYVGLVDYLNDLNATWVKAYERISPRVLIDQLESSGQEYNRYLATLDLGAKATFSVAWAGQNESTNWFHIAREYTEKWHHQMQIREAVGEPLLLSRDWYHPVLETFMQALPYNYRQVESPKGTGVQVVINGEAGGEWCIERREANWQFVDTPSKIAASVRIDHQDAWKIFTKGLSFEEAKTKTLIEGDVSLGEIALKMVAVMG